VCDISDATAIQPRAKEGDDMNNNSGLGHDSVGEKGLKKQHI
jgi:hypothetical protein